jgi:hypothetical protein
MLDTGVPMTPSRKLLLSGLLASTFFCGPALTGQALAQIPQAPPTSPDRQVPATPPQGQDEPGAEALDQGPVADASAAPKSDAGAPQSEEDATEVEAVVVTGFVPNEKRATSEISQVITAADLERTGDSDIAEALQRVPGLSQSREGFVFVRGLNERYSAALLDGSTLPSPLPLRRQVPLDLFPTALLSGALVQKTYSVEYPAEFGGGLVALRSRAVPNEPFFEIQVSAGYNSESTGEDGLYWDSTELDWLGINKGELDFPRQLRLDPSLNSFNDAQLQEAGRSLRNRWSLDFQKNAPDLGISLTAGTNFSLFGRRAGVLVAMNYDNEARNIVGTRAVYSNSAAGVVAQERIDPQVCAEEFPTAPQEGCGFRRTDWEIKLNGIGVFGFEIDDNNELKFTSLLLRTTTQQGLIERGSFASDPGTLRSFQRLTWIEQQVNTNQLSGEHEFEFGEGRLFDEADFTWRASYATASRETPYRREYTYQFDGDVFRLVGTTASNTTIFSALEDENVEVGGDLVLQGDRGGRELIVKLGGLRNTRDREFAQRRYQFNVQNAGSELRSFVPEIIFSPDNIGPPGGVFLTEATDPSDFFSGSLEVSAGYVSAEYEILPDRLRFTAGARYEKSDQQVDTVDLNNQPITAVLNNEFLLPAATVTFEFARNMQFRVGASRTISRPDLRELSRAEFLDEETDQLERGNPNLITTEIDNFDARYEWYFGRGQSFTLGVFYKNITAPIERTFGVLGLEPLRSFQNAERAELAGAEIELEANIPVERLIGDVFGPRDFFVIANGSYIDSEVTIDPATAGAAQQTSRRLQGQSEYLANLQFGYESDSLRERATIVVNHTGERIFDVGLFGAPNIIEEATTTVDFAAAKGFRVMGRELELGLRVENILGEGFKLTQGGQPFEVYDRGTTVSLGLTARF